MKKRLTPIFFFLITLKAVAQQYEVPPCPVPGTSYYDAPLIDCCLDGYHFMTQPVGGQETPVGFCGTVDNGQWLAFRAGVHVTDMTIGIEVNNCMNPLGNQGIQIQVFGIGNTCGLSSLFPVSNCIETNGIDSITATNLVAGHVYYLLLDGNGGDICEYTIWVLNTEKCSPPPRSLVGPTTVSFGQAATYTLVTPPDTCDYELHNPCNNIKQDTVTCIGQCNDNTPADTIWTGPPGSTVTPIPGTLSANITFGPIGGLITVTLTGPCQYETYSLMVNVCLPPPPPTISGPQQLCEGEAAFYSVGPGPFNYVWSLGSNIPFIPINANTISVPSPASGIYCVGAMNNCGISAPSCIPVTVFDNPVTQFAPLSLCQDDLPYDFQGQSVSTSGNYQVVLTSWNGCDSIVMQQITVLPTVAASITSSNGTMLPVSGSTVLDAGAGFANYLWSDGSTGQTLSTDQPGTYSVVVTSSEGCTATASLTLSQVVAPCQNFNTPIAPSDSCSTAPPFCDSYLNGFCSSNAGYTPDTSGNLNSVIPCTIENNQWLSFVACSDTVQLVLDVNSCAGAMGLEFFVLQTTDCQIFSAQTACHEIANGTVDTLFLPNLQPGNTYYLMVDGVNGDVCNWEVLSTSGISDGATYQEDNTPGQVIGPAAMCAGSTATYTFTSPICNLIPVGGCPVVMQQFCTPHLDTCIAMQYDTIWHVTPAGTVFVNNDSMGLTVIVTFPDSVNAPPGGSVTFQIAVELVPVPVDTLPCWEDCLGLCGTIIPDTDPCAILPLDVTVGNPLNTFEAVAVCPGECVDFYGQTFCQPGTYTVTDTSQYGCANMHELTLDWIQEPPPFIGTATESCDPTGAEYTVSFDVFAFGSFVMVNGQPLSGIQYTSAPIPSGQPYNFVIEVFGQCEAYTEVVSGTYTCPPCIGNTFDLGTMTLCPGECFDLQGNTYCTPGDYQEQIINPQTNCLETYVFSLAQIVDNQLIVGAVSEFCDASNLYYSIGFSIDDGTPPYTVNGSQITGNFYQSGLIPTGQSYAFTVTDAAACNLQQITVGGVFTCPCVNSPGTVNLATINQCEGEMAAVEFNNDAVIGPSDIQVFILHTGSGNSLGSIIGTNATGSFGFVPGLMSYGQPYYISSAVGPDMGGTVDMSSACFSISPGQPIVFYEKPMVEILPTDTLNCLTNSLTINSLPSGGSGSFSFAWTGPNGFVSTVDNPMVGDGGDYMLVLTDNLTGCEAQAATLVAIDVVSPVFTVTNSEINCQQPNATLEAASQTPGLTYTWTFPTGDVMTGSTISTNIPGGYIVTALGPNGCTAEEATFVTDNGTPPSLTVTGGTLNCSQPTVELVTTTNEPAATFTWLLPDTTIATGSAITTSLPGVYSVTAAAPNGCTTEVTTEVVEGSDPELVTEVEVKDPTCFGYSDGSIKVLGTMGGTAPYEYTLNDTLMGDFFQDLPAGSYVLNTTDADGCMGTDTVQLVDPQEVIVQIGDDQFVNLGQSVTLTMQANITPASIVWYGPSGRTWSDATELTISPTESGRYFIVISDVSSCRSSDTTYIYVSGQGKVFIPNVFSPNGDSNNDLFMLFAGGDVEQIVEMKIFDRWGETVFEDRSFAPNDPAHGWDGRHKGKPMDPAVFVVTAVVRFKDGVEKMVIGDVTLLR